MIDRKIAPEYTIISNLEPIQNKEFVLNNGVKVFYFFADEQDCVKLDFVFDAGSYNQNQSLVAFFTNKMLLEGTSKKSAAEISEIFDDKGAFINTEVEKDNASLTLFSLNKHLADLLPVVAEILSDANFDESELSRKIEAELQDFMVENEKVSTINRKIFLEKLFSSNHPYGKFATENDFSKINTKVLKDFFSEYYQAKNMTILASGNISDEVLNLLNENFGSEWKKESEIKNHNYQINNTFKPEKIIVQKEGAIQSSIRIGMPTFNLTHEDYFGLKVLSTILGGYFGSRLMMNIREDKGYTYGIGSGLSSYKHHGFFYISTEVGVDVAEDTVKEIFIELERLRNDLVEVEELTLVKNYMVGNILRSLDGAFDLADRFKNLYQFGLNMNYYKNYLNVIKSIDSFTLKALANKYFKEENLTTVVVGTRE
jgi:zinc protease